MAIILITGTSSGIGLATALHLARQKHHVYATMRNPESGSGPLKEAAQKEGLKLSISQLDVDDPDSVARAIGEVQAQAGHIDVLVNNAGISIVGSIERTEASVSKRIFETNFFGVLRTIRAVLPRMRERRAGTIVNVSSIAGRVSFACVGLYCATKHALEAASEALAQEVRPFGIRVAIIEPGVIVTPILSKIAHGSPEDPLSPYANWERRWTTMFTQGNETGGDPRVVAQTIEHAITTKAPKLRYLVGVDAPVFVEGRRHMSDEEWIDSGHEDKDEEFWTAFGRRFPMPAHK